MRRGLTTLELLVALAVTSITGLGVAMVITSVSRGVTTMNDTRAAMQRAAASHVRLREITDTSLCLLAQDERGFALWAHDERSNDQVNVSELAVVWYDGEKSEVYVEFVSYPEALGIDEIAAADIVLGAAEDPFQAMLDQRALGYTELLVLADGVSTMSVSHTPADPQDSDRFRVLVGFSGAGDTEELLMAVGMPEYRRPQ